MYLVAINSYRYEYVLLIRKPCRHEEWNQRKCSASTEKSIQNDILVWGVEFCAHFIDSWIPGKWVWRFMIICITRARTKMQADPISVIDTKPWPLKLQDTYTSNKFKRQTRGSPRKNIAYAQWIFVYAFRIVFPRRWDIVLRHVRLLDSLHRQTEILFRVNGSFSEFKECKCMERLSRHVGYLWRMQHSPFMWAAHNLGVNGRIWCTESKCIERLSRHFGYLCRMQRSPFMLGDSGMVSLTPLAKLRRAMDTQLVISFN